ncbi:unnamed protein product, partial [Medioppia subpectinata]
MATNSVNEKHLIANRLLESVKQCQIRFGGRSELATDMDQRVVKLCQSLEEAFSHGLRKNRNLIHYKRRTAKNGLPRSSSSNQGFTDETTVCFWHFVSLHLTRHEFDRYLLLRNIRTDTGRGKAWLRSALNEHSLERYVLSLLSDSLCLRNDFYEENAFMRDEEINSVLPTISRGLNSILFAINIDNSEFDVFAESKTLDKNHRSDPLPVVCKSESTTGVRKRRTRVNVISLSDDERADEPNAARSAPTTCLSSPDSVFADKHLSTTYDTNNSSLTTNQSMERNVVLTPFGAENVDHLELMVDNSGSDFDKLTQSLLVLKILFNLSSSLLCLHLKKVSKLLTQNDNLHKDNELLQMQLNKYIAAVQLLKYSAKQDTECAANPSEPSFETTKAFETQNESYFTEISEYEKKLVEVAEMHAELVEFNQHLHRVIAQKDQLITRIKHELIHLRGP